MYDNDVGFTRLFPPTMASRPLPSSLSPHICILSSPDLKELLTAASLPQLSDIFQSFSPLPQGQSMFSTAFALLTQDSQ